MYSSKLGGYSDNKFPGKDISISDLNTRYHYTQKIKITIL